jgi:hypothetical protein
MILPSHHPTRLEAVVIDLARARERHARYQLTRMRIDATTGGVHTWEHDVCTLLEAAFSALRR